MKMANIVKHRQPMDVEQILAKEKAMESIVTTAREQMAFREFFDLFTPILKAELASKETSALRNDVYRHIAEAALSDEWKWAERFFVRMAIDGERYDEDMTQGREARVSMLYRYFAEYINDHRDLVDKLLLGWAYWNYDLQFSEHLKLEEEYIEKLIAGIDSEELLTTFRSIEGIDVECYRQLMKGTYPSCVAFWEVVTDGADYGELPEWIGYISLYLQDAGNLRLLNKLFEQLRYPLLQSTLGYHVLWTETAFTLLKDAGDDILRLVFLEMWYRNFAREGSTLQLYESEQPRVSSQILQEGKKLFKQWNAELGFSVEDILHVLEPKTGWDTIFEWYFCDRHRRGSGLYSKEIQNRLNEAIEIQLTQVFGPKMLAAGNSNQAFIQFVCNQSLEKFEDKESWMILRSAIERLFGDIHERPLPKFEASSLPLWRGYAYAFARTSDELILGVQRRMNEVRTYFEGYLDEQDSSKLLEKIYRECFTLSSMMLIAELDNIDEAVRKAVFDEVVERLFQQIDAADGDALRASYIVPLQTAVLVSSQIMKDRQTWVLNRTANELPDFYEMMQVISVAKSVDEDTMAILKDRWAGEKEVIALRSDQIDGGKKYREIEQWVEGMR